MDPDLESSIAIAGIATSSLLAIAAIFQNALAVRKSNRIAISTKLVEASKLLNDELTARCRSYHLFVTELKDAESHPDSDAKAKKIENLRGLIENSDLRQKELDDHIDQVQKMFRKLDAVDVGILDSAIAGSYGQQMLATSGLELAKELTQRNENA